MKVWIITIVNSWTGKYEGYQDKILDKVFSNPKEAWSYIRKLWMDFQTETQDQWEPKSWDCFETNKGIFCKSGEYEKHFLITEKEVEP